MSQEAFYIKDALILTRDPVQREKLRRKKEEYETRYLYQAPEVCPFDTYKLQLLQWLLTKMVVDVEKVEREYAQYTWHQPVAFSDAVNIIRAYNSGDLTGIRGGTGLK